jgi:hypothetical protein
MIPVGLFNSISYIKEKTMEKEEICVYIDRSNYFDVMDVLKKHGETLCTGTDIEVSGIDHISPGYNWIQLDEYGAWWVGKKCRSNSGDTLTKITLEQLDTLLTSQNKNQDPMKTIKKSELKRIYDVACPTWQTRIESYAYRNPFGDTVSFSADEVEEMFRAATSEQKPVLESVFGKQESKLDFRCRKFTDHVDGIQIFGTSGMRAAESFIGLPRIDLDMNAFFLNPEYQWELKGTQLWVTKKK